MRALTLPLCLLLTACGIDPLPGEADESDMGFDDETLSLQQGLVSCAESQSTGYRSGSPFPVTLISVDGRLVEKTTGNAYAVMQSAAAGQGVGIRINSGFRTPQEQQYLYNCYVNCNCNSCNLAARPGYSNHQSGTALDLNTANGAVLSWLNANGARFGFRRTVPSEPWHWEYFGGGPGGGPCSAPPPPPPCDRSAGPFTFSCDGAQAGMACVNVAEPADPHTWSDNFFCSQSDLGMRWSHAGPIAGMTCVNVAEPAETNPAIWADNYLCTPPQSPWKLSWSSAGPIAGRTCVHWNETVDPGSWSDNYLCAEPIGEFSAAGFTFSGAGARSGACVNVDEPSDPDTWSDNFFCSSEELGMRWSYAGPLAGMACTNVAEAAEAKAPAWADNYLCVPESARVRFHWSSAGPIEGLPCVRWFEHADTSPTWIDNWMCIETLLAPAATEPAGDAPPALVEVPRAGADRPVRNPGVQPLPDSWGGPGADLEPALGANDAVAGSCSAAPGLLPLLALLALRARRRRA